MLAVLLAGCIQQPLSGAPLSFASAATPGSVQVEVLAVAQTMSGETGVAYPAEVSVIPGTGIVYVATEPATETDIQASATLAAQQAAKAANASFGSYDYLVHFTGNTSLIGGPSAGSQLALAFYVALWNDAHPAAQLRIDPTVAGTGTIESDGSIGLIGGAIAKANAVHDAGLKTFIYPEGQTGQVITGYRHRAHVTEVSLDSTCKSLALTCIPVANLDALIRTATQSA